MLIVHMRRLAWLTAGLLACSCSGLPVVRRGGPHQATGLKIGEVTPTSAVVWTRGTRKKERGLSQVEFDEWLEDWDRKTMFMPNDFSDIDVQPEEPGPVGTVIQGDGQIVAKPADALLRAGQVILTNPPAVLRTADKLAQKARGALPVPSPVNIRNGILRQGMVPGAPGKVTLTYRPLDFPGAPLTTKELPLRKSHDHTRQVRLDNLIPGTRYEVVSSMTGKKGGAEVSTLKANFRTPPAAHESQRVSFTVVTGQAFRTTDDISRSTYLETKGTDAERKDRAIMGHRIYPAMLSLKPDFMVHTGDVVYYDHQGATARSVRTARIWWQRMFSLRNMIDFHLKVPVYYMKDDHDTLKNDCWPGQRNRWLSYREGRAIFHEQTPLSLEGNLSINGGMPYRTVRWGRHLQIWLTEMRDYRDPNTKNYDDPDKSMLGKKQIDWLEETLSASYATFRIVICQGPVVGPDRPELPDEEEKTRLVNRLRPPRIDNLANPAWRQERARLLELFDRYENLILIVGDRHWKYHSVWPDKTEPRLHELCCGSVSDKHAQSGLGMVGVPAPHDDELLVWRDEVEQGGFISVDVNPSGSARQPTATVRFHKVDGSMAYPVNSAGRREVVFRSDGTVIDAR